MPRLLPLLCACFATLAAACSTPTPAAPPAPPAPAEGPKRGGVLNLMMSPTGEPASYDLHRESVASAMELGGPIYEGLVKFDPLAPTKLVPDLATGWDASADGLTYTFRLRPGVRFHSGGAFTAEDAAFSLQRMQTPPAGMVSPRKPVFDSVTAVEAVGPTTLTVRLSRPTPALLPNLGQGWMAMYERAWVQAGSPDRPSNEYNGTGPFRFKSHQKGTVFEVDRNPSYWDPARPYLDGIKLLVIPDFSTRTAALRTGQAVMARVFPADADDLSKNLGDKVTVSRQPAQSFGALTMNARRAPFDNPKVREAINLAIDRRANIQLLAAGAGDIGGYMMPGGAWSLPPEEIGKLPGYGADKAAELDQARALLAEAGYPNGFSTTITTRQGQTLEATAVVVADQLRRIGIAATVKPMETTRVFDAGQRGDFDLLTLGIEYALDDPDAVYGEFYACNGTRNYFGLCIPEVDALYQRQSRELDPDRRRQITLELERTAVPKGIKVITHWLQRVDVWWSHVKGYVPHPAPFNNARYRDVWLDR